MRVIDWLTKGIFLILLTAIVLVFWPVLLAAKLYESRASL